MVCKSRNLPKEACNMAVIVGGIDKLKTINFEQQSVLLVILDELCPGDSHAVQFWSEGIAKSLFCRDLPTTIHCKGTQEASIPASTALIVTGNAEYNKDAKPPENIGEKWFGYRTPFTKPIERKMMVATVTERFLAPLKDSMKGVKKTAVQEDLDKVSAEFMKTLANTSSSSSSSSNA